jgi:hypothetical protein
MKTKSWLSCAVLAVVLCSCGGNGGLAPMGPSALSACPSAPACGGDIVGTWTIASTCLGVDLRSYTDGCQGSVAQPNDYQLTGTITYDANMMFTVTSTVTGTVTVRYPAACLTPPDGVEVTCDKLEAGLLAPGMYKSVQCVSNGTGCDCTFEGMPETESRSGPYEITGMSKNVLVAQAVDESDYCVNGDGTATLATHLGSPVMGHFDLTGGGSLTLTKQP